jgi:8-oxo-dGTP pyrophosphatase MutT (NUDIX family)
MAGADIQNVVVVAIIQRLRHDREEFLFVRENSTLIAFPGGKVKEDKTLQEVLRRELLEETGFDVAGQPKLVAIEHTAKIHVAEGEIVRSRLLYFFKTRLASKATRQGDKDLLWLDSSSIDIYKGQILFDNYLIMTLPLNSLVKMKFVVPDGYVDSPVPEGGDELVQVRQFFR